MERLTDAHMSSKEWMGDLSPGTGGLVPAPRAEPQAHHLARIPAPGLHPLPVSPAWQDGAPPRAPLTECSPLAHVPERSDSSGGLQHWPTHRLMDLLAFSSNDHS